MTDARKALESAREAAFDLWWGGSKYTQVVYSGPAERQIAIDAWRAALSAIDAALASGEQGWRTDMENAPRDGTKIDLWFQSDKGGYREADACWSRNEWDWQQRIKRDGWVSNDNEGGYSLCDVGVLPSHWMLVSAPPAPETRK